MLLIYPFYKHLRSNQIVLLFSSVGLQAVQILAPKINISVSPEVLGEFFFIKSMTDKGSGYSRKNRRLFYAVRFRRSVHHFDGC